MGAGGDDADGMALVDTHRPAEAPGTATSNSDIRVGLTFWQEAAQQLKLAWPVRCWLHGMCGVGFCN